MNSLKFDNFQEFFKKATGKDPYPYQTELSECYVPKVISLPTGSGKTETAVLALWLWKRLGVNNDKIPRRLIYCLPMRVLVEQTRDRIQECLQRLNLNDIKVEVIMGGSEDKIQEILPNKECVLVGTQDMLVSGALNRAYGNSPYTWPIIFGLLNNDCMWIMDEVQIMENALPTSVQLDTFRSEFETCGPHMTVWMSATINPKWLETVDTPKEMPETYKLKGNNAGNALDKRNKARKTLHKTDIIIKNQYLAKDAKELLKLHKPGTATVIMVNTVKRAQELRKILEKERVNPILVHSRFTGADRDDLNKKISNLEEGKDAIVVSTQVLEAGVDISVRTMITEIAPWPNLVQRFGRCNRNGNLDDADVHWVDLDDKSSPPYKIDDFKVARERLESLDKESVAPDELPDVSDEKIFDSVLRRQDLISLFDTTPDLSGRHIDVSRFVRSMDQNLDVEVFWRYNAGEQDQPKPERDEICSVHVGELQRFLKKREKHAYVWSYPDRRWLKAYPSEIRPGQILMLDSKVGGYSEYGWDEESHDPVKDSRRGTKMPDSDGDDPSSRLSMPVTLEDHTKHVINEAESFIKSIRFIDGTVKESVITAARYHDIGKTHKLFQNAMKRNMDAKFETVVLAKSHIEGRTHYSIPGFRHEVASALAYLAQDRPSNEDKDLVAYLIMSHHGKVRLSLKRHYRKNMQDADRDYLLGIKVKGDRLPKFTSAEVSIEKTQFDMSSASMGRNAEGFPSWTERVITVRDRYGPFRLAYLEGLLRRADWLASEKEGGDKYGE